MDANKIINKLGMTSVMVLLSVYGYMGNGIAITVLGVLVVLKTILQFVLWGAHGSSISNWEEYKTNFTTSDWDDYVSSTKAVILSETPVLLRVLINISWIMAVFVLYKDGLVLTSILYLVSTALIQTFQHTLRRLVKEETDG